MDRWEAQYYFWSSFGVPAYEENSVPDDVDFPYITYQAVSAGFDEVANISASVWTRSPSWETADRLADAIEARLDGGAALVWNTSLSGGLLWITPNAPFAQNMGDPNDDLVKRKLMSATAHY